MKNTAILDKLKHGLIVSCQVQKDDPIYSDDIVVKMAQAAKWAGAVGIRANIPEQIAAIRAAVDLPIIGLWKIWHDDTDVFITPTLEAARKVWEAGADIIALDCTDQITHEGRPAWELLPVLQWEIPEALFFADISNYDEAARAVSLGAEIVGPTLYGYTKPPPTSNTRIFGNLPGYAGTLGTRPVSSWKVIFILRRMRLSACIWGPMRWWWGAPSPAPT